MTARVIYPVSGIEWNTASEFECVLSICVHKDTFIIEFTKDNRHHVETLNFKEFPKGTILEVTYEEGVENEDK